MKGSTGGAASLGSWTPEKNPLGAVQDDPMTDPPIANPASNPDTVETHNMTASDNTNVIVPLSAARTADPYDNVTLNTATGIADVRTSDPYESNS